MPLTKQADKYRGRARRSRAQLERERARDAKAVQLEHLVPQGDGTINEFLGWTAVTLKVPTGPLRGKPLIIQPWQSDWLRDALAPGIRECGLSVARKNGKSGLVAALCLGYLVGPLRTPLWRGIAISLTGGLATELRTAIIQTAAASNLSDLISTKSSPPPGSIRGLDGTELTLLASDKASGHAVGADLAIIDEAGLLEENRRELWNAVFSSISARDGRLMCISIRGHGPMYSELADRAGKPNVHFTEFAAPEGCDLDDADAWHAANPGLGSIKSLNFMKDAAERAITTPADARIFRAFELNQPQDPKALMLVEAADWQRCETEVLPPASGPMVLAMDLSSGYAMSAAASYWPETGRLQFICAFPDDPGLKARGDADGVGSLYEQMADRGELITTPGRTVEIGILLHWALTEFGYPAAVVCDRWRLNELKDAVEAAGVPAGHVITRGMGWQDGSEDVRAFQRAVKEGRVKAPVSLAVRSALSGAVTVADPAGNLKLAKATQGGRRARHKDDIAAAAILAVSAGVRHWRPEDESEEVDVPRQRHFG